VNDYLLAPAPRDRSRHPVLGPFALRSFYEYLRSAGSHRHQPDGQDQGPRCPQAAHRGIHRRRGRPDPGPGRRASPNDAGASATSSWPPWTGRACAATRSPCGASTRWTSRPGASRSSARGQGSHRAHRSRARPHPRRLSGHPAPQPPQVRLPPRQPECTEGRANAGRFGPMSVSVLVKAACKGARRGVGTPLPPPPGAAQLPPASCGVERTSTSSVASSPTQTSPRRRATCISQYGPVRRRGQGVPRRVWLLPQPHPAEHVEL
jgi:hypothetical protein